jgi:TetR/AcrR family transcriptional regulator
MSSNRCTLRVMRRAPEPEERRRDAERTRRALLDAALAEFADKGRAGARVSEIAARAGVNKQLISYYFGGKDGLYEAIVERWNQLERSFDASRLALEDLVIRYLQAAVEERDLHRAFVREMLDGDLEGEAVPDEEAIADLRRRQEEGELAADLDAGLVLLLFQAAVAAGVIFGRDARDIAGVDPRSAEFVERYGALLRRVVRCLKE